MEPFGIGVMLYGAAALIREVRETVWPRPINTPNDDERKESPRERADMIRMASKTDVLAL